MHRHGTQLRLFDFSGAVDGGRDLSQKGNSTAPGRSVVTLEGFALFLDLEKP